MIKNIHFTFHPERCVGCGACVMACINENEIDIDQQMPYRLLKSNEYSDDETLNIIWFVYGCMHCADSPCAQACPKNCFHREPDFGTVQLDNSACIGCKRCEKACSFGAIQYTKDRKAAKCHGCLKRLREGQLPLCVQACPRRALTVDEKNRIVTEGREALKKELNK